MASPLIESFEALQAQLTRENLPFQVAPDVTKTVTLPTKLGAIDSVMHIRWEGTPGIVQFVQTIPLVVPEASRSTVGEQLHRINLRNAVEGYTFDADTGIVAFRLQAFLGPEKSLAPGMVGALISVAVHTVSDNLAEIEQAAGTKAT